MGNHYTLIISVYLLYLLRLRSKATIYYGNVATKDGDCGVAACLRVNKQKYNLACRAAAIEHNLQAGDTCALM